MNREIYHDSQEDVFDWDATACRFCDQLLDSDGRCEMCDKADELDVLEKDND